MCNWFTRMMWELRFEWDRVGGEWWPQQRFYDPKRETYRGYTVEMLFNSGVILRRPHGYIGWMDV